VIVIDDLISGGTTLARAAAASVARGARGVHAAATHAVLAAGAAATLGGAPLESIVVTDTVSDVRKRGALLAATLCVLEIAPVFSTAIERLLDAGGTGAPTGSRIGEASSRSGRGLPCSGTGIVMLRGCSVPGADPPRSS
jgi:hypothetical protein